MFVSINTREFEMKKQTRYQRNQVAVFERIYRYDKNRQRLWVAGQRLHHGVTGIALTMLGTALIAHDWKDRSVWFQREPFSF